MNSKIYPIGSIYISVNSANPKDIFGGTWEQIKDRFILSAGDTYEAGSIGGEATHILTMNEMPKHDGHIAAQIAGGVPAAGNLKGFVNQSVATPYGDSGRGWNVFAGNELHPAGINQGGDAAHNNMPPYLAVYVWKRTA